MNIKVIKKNGKKNYVELYPKKTINIQEGNYFYIDFIIFLLMLVTYFFYINIIFYFIKVETPG